MKNPDTIETRNVHYSGFIFNVLVNGECEHQQQDPWIYNIYICDLDATHIHTTFPDLEVRISC